MSVPYPYKTQSFGVIEHSPPLPPQLISPFWSGVMLQGSPGPFGWVQGNWVVPSVMGDPSKPQTPTVAFTWVGIDGYGTTAEPATDLAQAGTEEVGEWVNGMNQTVYTAWSELLPNQQLPQAWPDIHVNANDEFFAEVSVGFAASPDVLPGYYMILWMGDFQTHASIGPSYIQLNDTRILGKTVEWIMEREQTSANQYSELANFGNAKVFYGTLARQANAPRHKGWVNCCGVGSALVNMTSDGTASGTKLSTVNLNGGTINFTWGAFQ
ncbi:MAG: G1 family glutamic endopeptidase [Terriglobales bacterium]